MVHTLLFPQLIEVEESFNWEKGQIWIQENWTLSLYADAIYVAIIFLGKWWMRDRPAYSLRRPLAMWNTGLAVFSMFGFLRLWPTLLDAVRENGFAHTACNRLLFASRTGGLWGLLFALSKLMEFGDTVFVVLRKTPLNFLHWYHHISVCAYCAYSVGYADPTVEWCGMANLFVHSVMYSYYVLKAIGVKVPRAVAQCVTALQLLQFALCLAVIWVAFSQHRAGVPCFARKDVLWAGLLMYMSYVVLFGNFFYQRYLRHK